MTCKLHNMNRYELVQFAFLNANTPLEKALLNHMKEPITTQRKLRIKFWNTHRQYKRRLGGWACQDRGALIAWKIFLDHELNAGNISKHLALGATLAYQ